MFADKQTITVNKEAPFVFPAHLRHAAPLSVLLVDDSQQYSIADKSLSLRRGTLTYILFNALQQERYSVSIKSRLTKT